MGEHNYFIKGTVRENLLMPISESGNHDDIIYEAMHYANIEYLQHPQLKVIQPCNAGQMQSKLYLA